MAKKRLTVKQERFIEEYVIDGNATQAAIRAGYSPHTANVQGSQNLTKLSKHPYFKRKICERRQQLEKCRDRLIEELEAMAFTSIDDVCTFSPKTGLILKPFDELLPEQLVGLKEVIYDKGGKVVGVTMYNKISVLRMLAKALRVY